MPENHSEANAKIYEALHQRVWGSLKTTHVLYHEAYDRYQRTLARMRMSAIRGESICGSTYKAMLQEQRLVDEYYKKMERSKHEFDQMAEVACIAASHPDKKFVLTIHPDGSWSIGPDDGSQHIPEGEE